MAMSVFQGTVCKTVYNLSSRNTPAGVASSLANTVRDNALLDQNRYFVMCTTQRLLTFPIDYRTE